MNTNFNTYQTSSRIYLAMENLVLEKSIDQKEKSDAAFGLTLYKDGKELKGFGFTKYGNLLGAILSLFGYAFKTYNEDGKAVYININSFCKGIIRFRLSDTEEDTNNFYNGRIEENTVTHMRTIFSEVFKKHPKLDLHNFYNLVKNESQRTITWVLFYDPTKDDDGQFVKVGIPLR